MIISIFKLNEKMSVSLKCVNEETTLSGGGGQGREKFDYNTTKTHHSLKLATEQLFMLSLNPAFNVIRMEQYTSSPTPTHNPEGGSYQFLIPE